MLYNYILYTITKNTNVKDGIALFVFYWYHNNKL